MIQIKMSKLYKIRSFKFYLFSSFPISVTWMSDIALSWLCLTVSSLFSNISFP